MPSENTPSVNTTATTSQDHLNDLGQDLVAFLRQMTVGTLNWWHKGQSAGDNKHSTIGQGKKLPADKGGDQPLAFL